MSVSSLRCELAVLLADGVLLDRLRDERLEPVELLRVERLLDVVVRALAHRLNRGVDRRLAGDDDALGGYRARLQLLQDRESIDLRHLEIGEGDAEAAVLKLVERLLAVARAHYVIAFVGKDRAQALGDCLLVIGDEDALLGDGWHA